MTTSSQALVTNLLVQKFQGLDITVDIEGTATPVPIYDGPQGPAEDDNYVVIMGWPSEAESSSTEAWSYLGTATRYENYDLAIMIFSFVGGDDSDASYDASDAQALARTNATTIQAAIEAACLADINLSVQNGGTAPIIWGLIREVRFDQTPPEEESEMGRFAQYALRYHVYNVLWTA